MTDPLTPLQRAWLDDWLGAVGEEDSVTREEVHEAAAENPDTLDWFWDRLRTVIRRKLDTELAETRHRLKIAERKRVG